MHPTVGTEQHLMQVSHSCHVNGYCVCSYVCAHLVLHANQLVLCTLMVGLSEYAMQGICIRRLCRDWTIMHAHCTIPCNIHVLKINSTWKIQQRTIPLSLQLFPDKGSRQVACLSCFRVIAKPHLSISVDDEHFIPCLEAKIFSRTTAVVPQPNNQWQLVPVVKRRYCLTIPRYHSVYHKFWLQHIS